MDDRTGCFHCEQHGVKEWLRRIDKGDIAPHTDKAIHVFDTYFNHS